MGSEMFPGCITSSSFSISGLISPARTQPTSPPSMAEAAAETWRATAGKAAPCASCARTAPTRVESSASVSPSSGAIRISEMRNWGLDELSASRSSIWLIWSLETRTRWR